MTAPYMHDGRFSSLDEVMEHYSHDIQAHVNLSDFLQINGNPIKLSMTSAEKKTLIYYLNMMTDSHLLSDSRYSNPFEPVANSRSKENEVEPLENGYYYAAPDIEKRSLSQISHRLKAEKYEHVMYVLSKNLRVFLEKNNPDRPITLLARHEGKYFIYYGQKNKPFWKCLPQSKYIESCQGLVSSEKALGRLHTIPEQLAREAGYYYPVLFLEKKAREWLK